MSPDEHQPHYFSAAVPSDAATQTTTVQLRGHQVAVTTSAGVFSKGHLDKGTDILLQNVPTPPATGTFVDVGCGWGPITIALALASPQAQVWAVDVNERARELTAANAAAAGCTNVQVFAPEEVPAEQPVELIWSNPPVRVGKAVLHELLTFWLGRLVPTGEGWFVVQKNLGADSLTRWLNEQLPDAQECTRAASAKGFRVLRVGPA